GQMFAVSCRQRMTASRPRKGPSTNPSAGRSVTSGCVISHSVGQSSAAYAAIARRKTLTFCSEIRGHLPANCAFSSVVGDGGYVVMTSPATPRLLLESDVEQGAVGTCIRGKAGHSAVAHGGNVVESLVKLAVLRNRHSEIVNGTW